MKYKRTWRQTACSTKAGREAASNGARTICILYTGLKLRPKILPVRSPLALRIFVRIITSKRVNGGRMDGKGPYYLTTNLSFCSIGELAKAFLEGDAGA